MVKMCPKILKKMLEKESERYAIKTLAIMN